MIVGVLTLEINLPHARSLKDKRQVVRGFKDRIRKRYNAAVAELEFQDKWQRTVIGITTLNSEPRIVEDMLGKILSDARNVPEWEIAAHEIRYV
jgi:uncharacterized protein YlxP (DUF503 family)